MLTPQEIVKELDKHIIGQDNAKKAVAIALRNRWRRMQLPSEVRTEITPKNILMIGPTGVGKTEIARRISSITKSPFLKVEATKFTEVGYVGKDVESIIRDLVEVSLKNLKNEEMKKFEKEAQYKAENQIIDELISSSSRKNIDKELLREFLNNGLLDELKIPSHENKTAPIAQIKTFSSMDPLSIEEFFQSLNENLTAETPKADKKLISVKDAKKLLTDNCALELIDKKELNIKAIENAENNGIVFIDEIDKICEKKQDNSPHVSREGVQRDLLPLIEGCSVKTKYGMVKTDHILFITSGAFQLSSPSDLIAELQGRLPIRVELSDLTVNDFERILVEPEMSITEQYIKLIQTEKVKLEFTKEAIKKIAQAAFDVNSTNENIGARRLHTITEKLLEDISFNACNMTNETVIIDDKYVEEHIGSIVENEDLSKYIL